jgi:hypothetical protein
MILPFQVSLLSSFVLLGYISTIYCCKRHHCKLCDISDEIKEDYKVLRMSKRLQEKQEKINIEENF